MNETTTQTGTFQKPELTEQLRQQLHTRRLAETGHRQDNYLAVVLAAEGWNAEQIGRCLGITTISAFQAVNRFNDGGLGALSDMRAAERA